MSLCGYIINNGTVFMKVCEMLKGHDGPHCFPTSNDIPGRWGQEEEDLDRLRRPMLCPKPMMHGLHCSLLIGHTGACDSTQPKVEPVVTCEQCARRQEIIDKLLDLLVEA